jgi:hypothetical protein
VFRCRAVRQKTDAHGEAAVAAVGGGGGGGPPPVHLRDPFETPVELHKSIAELIDQLNGQGDFAILSTAKTKIASSPIRGL